MKTFLMINPHAGRQNILKELDGVQQVFREAGDRVTVVETEDAGQAAAAINRALAEQADRLVCCGGDGTLSGTVSRLLELGADLPLGYIPAGTTNDFASSLGIPKDPVKAARYLVEKAPRPLDVGRFGERTFIYVASFGAFTQSSYQTDQGMKNALGHFAYVLEGLKELPTLKAYRLRVQADGDVWEGEYIFGAVSSATSFGGVVKLDPGQVDFSDGRLELTLVRAPKSLHEFNRTFFSLMSGKFDPEWIVFTHGERFAFTCGEPMPWSLDGEYDPGARQVEISAQKHALRMYY